VMSVELLSPLLPLNTALVESLTVNSDEIKRYARVVITVAGGTGAGAVSVVGLGRKKYN